MQVSGLCWEHERVPGWWEGNGQWTVSGPEPQNRNVFIKDQTTKSEEQETVKTNKQTDLFRDLMTRRGNIEILVIMFLV